jgi:DNA-directed RNA polymerase, mitochondrial
MSHAEQLAREGREAERAQQRTKATGAKARAAGRLASTPLGHELFDAHGELVAQALSQRLARFVEAPHEPGPHYAALPLLLQFADKGPRTIAAVALLVVLNRISEPQPHRKLAATIGAALEDEVRAGGIEGKSRQVLEILKRTQDRRRITSQWTMRGLQVEHVAWTRPERYQVGALLLDLIASGTGLIVIDESGGASHRTVRPEPGIAQLARAAEGWAMGARALPMVVPPRPWSGLRDGGALGEQSRLVRRRDGESLDYLEGESLSVQLDSVNRLQSQQLRVDPWMLAIQRQAWDANLPGLFKVQRDPLPMPPRPDRTEGKAAWKEWHRLQAAAFADRREGAGDRTRISEALRVAAEIEGRPVWFAYCLDFRGRIYTSSRALTHQGPDHQKALLSLPPERCDQAGAEWILRAAATHYGLSRARWEQRLQWGQDHRLMLEAVADDPLDHIDILRQAKDPWQFLQAARAWKDWTVAPSAGCGLPVRFDQTASGLGITAALMRSKPIGGATNLWGTEPQDIYSQVATVVRERLRSDLEAGEPKDQKMAAFWLDHGIPRAMAKPPVMTITYGAGFMGIADGIAAALLEESGGLQVWELEPKVLAPARYLARHFLAALKVETGAAIAVRDWLETVVRQATKAGKRVGWVSPMGMPIEIGATHDPREKANTLLHGSRRWASSWESEEILSANTARRGAMANLIHSFDGSQCQAIICRAAAVGAPILTNHDCFAATPSRAEWLHRTLHDELRATFQVDWLAEIHQQLEERTEQALPTPPMVGTLAPALIGSNPYAYC